MFAVESIRRWWRSRGRLDHPDADRLLITADYGGSNSYRYRLWKAELAAFAAETGLTVTVCHFPPGTSKWNKIEHQLFSHITMNWRGRPLTSHEVVVNSIAATRTRAGLRVHAELDTGAYPIGISVSGDYVRSLPITPHPQRGTWNYTIAPAGPHGRAVTTGERDLSRTRALAMLADPKATGMSSEDLRQLCERLAPTQAALAEQRKYLQRGGQRRQERGDHGRPLLSPADKVLVTVVYLRRVCPQKVLVDLLGINPNSIGKAIRETRALLEEQQIAISQTPHYFSSVSDLRHWLENDTATSKMEFSRALAHPSLTGMSRDYFHALADRISVPYRAAIERRRHHQRGGERRPGTRGGMFRQKITDADRILATVLDQRKLCDQHTLAELFGVSRGTIRNAIDDVLPLLQHNGHTITPSTRRFATATEIFTFIATNKNHETPS